ncbi:MAG: zinc ribbon domain-containing protein [Polaromonas sp.]|nr:zinc ribbon domain-containing protein [Polaromonas sp.]
MNTPHNSPPTRAGYMTALQSLVEATSAFRNLRAIILLGLTFVSAALVFAVTGALAALAGVGFIAAIGGLLGMLVAFYGANAVGILLMREVQGQPAFSVLDAVRASLASSHRVIGVVLLEILIVLVAVLVIAVILFVCKVPVLGPILLTVVFPLSALILGVLVFALFYVMLPLAGPAVWSGSTVFQTIARLNAIARRKLIPVILLEVALFVITLFTAMLIFTVVFIGISMTGGLSASIIGLGAGAGFGDMMGGMSFGGSGHMVAASIGGGLLLAIAAVVPGLIFAKGTCIIYLDVTRDIDFSQSEASLSEGLATVRKKAEEARDRAQAMAEQAKGSAVAAAAPAPAPTPPAEAAAPPAAEPYVAPAAPVAPAAYDSVAPVDFTDPQALPPAPAPVATATTAPGVYTPLRSLCPNCQAAIDADDVFCGNCGFKLK